MEEMPAKHGKLMKTHTKDLKGELYEQDLSKREKKQHRPRRGDMSHLQQALHPIYGLKREKKKIRNKEIREAGSSQITKS